MQSRSTPDTEALAAVAGDSEVGTLSGRSTLWLDALIVAVVTTAAAVVCALFNISELLQRWTAPWERIQLDEVPAILLALALGLVWFAVRRQRETRRELIRRVAAEARVSLALTHVRRLSQQYVAVQEQERSAIARELHDELGQYLQVIKLDAVRLRDRQPPDPAALAAQAGAIVDTCNHLHTLLTALLQRLRPVGLDELGLAAALEHCMSGWRQRLPAVTVQLTVSGELADVDEASALTVYRLVQEALTNAAKHAEAAHIAVRVAHSPDALPQRALLVEVSDDGRGFAVDAPIRGFGLLGMRERVEGLGGQLEVCSAVGRGTQLRARIPATVGVHGVTA